MTLENADRKALAGKYGSSELTVKAYEDEARGHPERPDPGAPSAASAHAACDDG
jgi:hypothetical protein